MADEPSPPGLWQGQRLHLSGLACLVAATAYGWLLLGRPAPMAFWTAVAVPVVHQVYVWLAWRLELRSRATSRAIGLRGYVALFFVLFFGRFLSLGFLGWVDAGSLGLPLWLRVGGTALVALPGLYAMYSVRRYFGMVRAAGADHFEARYREMPFVKGGIYRFTSNGMYLYAFLLFWALALSFDSMAALLAAGFAHAYIWVHFHATEKPDMAYIYGGR